MRKSRVYKKILKMQEDSEYQDYGWSELENDLKELEDIYLSELSKSDDKCNFCEEIKHHPDCLMKPMPCQPPAPIKEECNDCIFGRNQGLGKCYRHNASDQADDTAYAKGIIKGRESYKKEVIGKIENMIAKSKQRGWKGVIDGERILEIINK